MRQLPTSVCRRSVMLQQHLSVSLVGGALVPNQVVDYVRDLIAAKEEPLGTAYMEIKRLNHEVVDRIRTWLQAFGHNGVVGAVLRADVYKTANLADAQDEGVSIFWSHVLCTLGDVLRRTGIRTR